MIIPVDLIVIMLKYMGIAFYFGVKMGMLNKSVVMNHVYIMAKNLS